MTCSFRSWLWSAALLTGIAFGQSIPTKIPIAPSPVVTVDVNFGGLGDGPLRKLVPSEILRSLAAFSAMHVAMFDMDGDTFIIAYDGAPQDFPVEAGATLGLKARWVDGKLVMTKGNPPEAQLTELAHRSTQFAPGEVARLEIDTENIPGGWESLLKQDFGASLGLPGVSLKEFAALKGFAPDITAFNLGEELSSSLQRFTVQLFAADSQTLALRLAATPKPDSLLARFVAAQENHRAHDLPGWKYVPAESSLVFMLDVDAAAGSVWPETVLEAALSTSPWSIAEQEYLRKALKATKNLQDGRFLFATFDHPAAGPHAMLFTDSKQPQILLNSWFDYQSLLHSRESETSVSQVLAQDSARAQAGGFSGTAVARFLEKPSPNNNGLSKELDELDSLFSGHALRVGALSETGERPVSEFLFTASSAKGYNGAVVLAPEKQGLLAVAGGQGRTVLETVRNGEVEAMAPPSLPASVWMGIWLNPSEASHESSMLEPLAKAFSVLSFGQPVLDAFFEIEPVVAPLLGDIPGVDRVSFVSWATEGCLIAELKVQLTTAVSAPDADSDKDGVGAKPIN